jgi:hypothetical protein
VRNEISEHYLSIEMSTSRKEAKSRKTSSEQITYQVIPIMALCECFGWAVPKKSNADIPSDWADLEARVIGVIGGPVVFYPQMTQITPIMKPDGALQISRSEYLKMMPLVTGDDERQTSNRYLIVVSRATSIPGVIFEARKQRNGRAAYVLVFASQVFEAPLVEICASHEVVLFKARQRGCVTSPKPERSIGKNALSVDHVTQQLLDTPFAFSVSIIAASFRNATYESKSFF